MKRNQFGLKKCVGKHHSNVDNSFLGKDHVGCTFGKRKPYIDRDRERAAAGKVAVLCILGAVAAFGLGYALDDPKGGSAFAYIFGFALLVVAVAATHDAAGLDIDEEI